MKRGLILLVASGVLALPLRAAAADSISEPRRLASVRVSQPLVIDGSADDPAWGRAPGLTTRDPFAQCDLTIQSVYTAEQIFTLVQFPDASENREHKTVVWDESLERYVMGPKREDTFVFKWSMEPHPVDLSLSGDQPYTADIWYWKANRTDHAGYADDKLHIYSLDRQSDATKLLSKRGRRFYLTRRGDKGTSAYKTQIYPRRINDEMPLYEHRTPLGSRADVQAKGLWRDGVWTVEFSRDLVTGHADDVQFDPGQRTLFGVSRFEVAGRKNDPSIEQPHFGAGEVTEPLELVFR